MLPFEMTSATADAWTGVNTKGSVSFENSDARWINDGLDWSLISLTSWRAKRRAGRSSTAVAARSNLDTIDRALSTTRRRQRDRVDEVMGAFKQRSKVLRVNCKMCLSKSSVKKCEAFASDNTLLNTSTTTLQKAGLYDGLGSLITFELPGGIC